MNIAKLKGVMAEKGFSQRKLAQAIEMNKNTLWHKLQGKSPFSVIDADKICKALNITDSDTKVEIFLS